MKRIPFFKPGKHTAASGQVLEFSADDVRGIAESYDPAIHEAPLVIGHPKHNAPAYGLVKAVSIGDDGLAYAEPHKVQAEFDEGVREGRWPKRSASLYPPDAPNNPVPGKYYLRHIGFLGAQPPAIKGMPEVEFADDDQAISIEFNEAYVDRRILRMLRGLKNLLLGSGTFTTEAIEEALPEWQIPDAVETNAAAAADSSSTSYSEPNRQEQSTMTPEELKAKESAIAAREAAVAEKEVQFAEIESREHKLTEKERALQAQELANFCDGLIGEGKLLPAHKDGMVAFMAAQSSAQALEFGEGDPKQTPQPLDYLQQFLQSLPAQVQFAEIGKGGDDVPADKHENFGESVDEDRLDLHRRAKQIQKTESVSYTEALTKARNQE